MDKATVFSIVIILAVLEGNCAQVYNLNVGAFTDSKLDTQLQLDVIHQAIMDVRSLDNNTFNLELKSLTIDGDDNQSLIGLKICNFVLGGVAVVLGPLFYNRHEEILVSTSQINAIPYFRLHTDYHDTSSSDKKAADFVFDFSPSYTDLNNVTMSYMKEDQFKITAVQIMYDPENGIEALQEFIDTASTKKWEVHLTSIPMDGFGTPRWEEKAKTVLLRVKENGVKYFIMHCRFTVAKAILILAADEKMLEKEYHYLLTSPVGSISDGFLEGVRFDHEIFGAKANIYILSSRINERNFMKKLKNVVKNYDPQIVEEAKAMLAAQYDSIWAYAVALTKSGLSETDISIITAKRKSCNNQESNPSRIEISERIRDNIRKVDMDGITGEVEFNKDNTKTSSLNMGLFNRNKTRWANSWQKNSNSRTKFLQGSTLKVVAVVETPFVIRNKKPNEMPFSGFGIELLNKLAERIDFNYVIYEAKDKSFGIDTTGKGAWTGVIKELQEGHADIAIGVFPITSKRAQVVDFTGEFMKSEAVAVARIKTQKQADVFAFLKPFHINVWMSILVAFIMVGFVLACINTCDPNEWKLTLRQRNKAEEMQSLGALNISNSLWYTVTGILNQGSEINPRSLAGRILAGIWGLFGVIILGYYTANLTAFLTVTQSSQEINSIDQLSKQADLPYGILNNSALMDFLRYGQVPTYERLWLGINSNKKSGLVQTEEQGIIEAQQDKYVFIGDKRIIEFYMQEKPCDMTIVGSAIWKYGLGIVLNKGSTLTEKMTNHILQMRERGVIEQLKETWFKAANASCRKNINAMSSSSKKVSRLTKRIDFENISGVFYVLVAGSCLAILTSFLECAYFFFRTGHLRKFRIAKNDNPNSSVAKLTLENSTRPDSRSTWV